MNQAEKRIHNSICAYLKLQYPNVIFTSDGSGLRLPPGLAKQTKDQRCRNYKIPDLLIFKPSGKYFGLLLEIKKDANEIFKKNGSLRTDAHTQEQLKTLNELQRLGYYADFAPGFDNAKKIIDWYLGNAVNWDKTMAG